MWRSFVGRMECEDEFHLQRGVEIVAKPLQSERKTRKQAGASTGSGNQAQQFPV
ncbi:MAG: hypothetical protein ABSG91_16485 [Syntrophobacteraceae bacterium]